MRTGNLALRFVLELACLAALAYWGAGATASDAANVALAILAPLTAATVWGSGQLRERRGVCLAPAWRAWSWRGSGCCCALLAVAGPPIPATILFVLALTNAALLRRPETAAADRLRYRPWSRAVGRGRAGDPLTT